MQLAFIDFHDAVIFSVMLQGDSSVNLNFESLNCFYRVGPEEYEVWACAISIRCYGVQVFKVNGKLDSNVWVSHGSMSDAQQCQVLTLSSVESKVSSMSLTLFSGTEIQLLMDSAKLGKVERREHLENWTGPLR
jgi:hypothetical protein